MPRRMLPPKYSLGFSAQSYESDDMPNEAGELPRRHAAFPLIFGHFGDATYRTELFHHFSKGAIYLMKDAKMPFGRPISTMQMPR